jgi:hypothetical protein
LYVSARGGLGLSGWKKDEKGVLEAADGGFCSNVLLMV